MINKQLFLVTGLLIIGGFFSTTRALAVPPPPAHEGVPLTQYWNVIADHLGREIIANGRLGSHTVYVDEKPAASAISRYLEQRLSASLIKSGARVIVPSKARYAIELDVDIYRRFDTPDSTYADGSYIDRLWTIREETPSLAGIYFGQRAGYDLQPFGGNQQVNRKPLAGMDTEIIITARIMERGLIHLSQTHAFYFSAEDLKPQSNLDFDDYSEFSNGQNLFLDYQKKLDADIQELINSYQF